MINQTRTLLVVALVVVAVLLWQAWQHDYPAVAPTPATPATQTAASSAATVPTAAVPSAPAGSAVAAAPVASASTVPLAGAVVAATPAQDLVTASNDVLQLTFDPQGGTIVGAALLKYPKTVKKGSPPVQLLTTAAADYYVAQNGLVGIDGSVAPDHLAEFKSAAPAYTMVAGQNQVVATFTWQDPTTGVGVVKRYTLTRGSYVIGLTQEIENHGKTTWHGSAYEQLDRVDPPPPPKHFLEFYNPDSWAYTGGAWYSPESKFNKLPFGDFAKEPVNQTVTGGWVAMAQRFFVSAWIPDAKQPEQFSSVEVPASGAGGKPRYIVRALGPQMTVAPGASATSDARLYIGPQLQNEIGKIAPGLNLAIDYGWFTVIATPTFKLLSFLHALVHNWGAALIVLVLLIQAATWKLMDKSYEASARMRKFQPRLKALKERFGDDKQKYQQAMMELYKKEKINPMGGCLPQLIIYPIFFALYYVLIYSVELRHAAFLWIPDLSAADPYFILPVLYTLTMIGTTFLMPQQQGMDPNAAKMMKFMPVLFAVLFFFFPAGLTLYYVIRGICNLGQQWHVTRRVERTEGRAHA